MGTLWGRLSGAAGSTALVTVSWNGHQGNPIVVSVLELACTSIY